MRRLVLRRRLAAQGGGGGWLLLRDEVEVVHLVLHVVLLELEPLGAIAVVHQLG